MCRLGGACSEMGTKVGGGGCYGLGGREWERSQVEEVKVKLM